MKTHAFEQLSAKFVANSIKYVDERLISVVYSSPLCARSPDLFMVWHPGYYEKNKLKLFVNGVVLVLRELFRGGIKLVFNLKPFNYVLQGSIADSLLIVPSNCAISLANGTKKTAYVKTDGTDGLFIFGPAKTCGLNERKIQTIATKQKIVFLFSLLGAGISAALATKGQITERLLLINYWFAWALSLQWLDDYYLEKVLFEIVRDNKINKIGCIHEMHAYARLVWRIADKCKIKSYTVQHAAISYGKRWYFCYPEELISGLKLPSTIYVYDDETAKMLTPYFPNTIFKKGCSSRYVHWKVAGKSTFPGKYYLYVSALPAFDNDILFEMIKRTLSEANEFVPLRIRLHPFAIVSRQNRNWLKKKVENKQIEYPKNSGLNNDLINATAVIGVGSTVLEEALLLGRPAIQITHPDYLRYVGIGGITGTRVIDHREFSWKDLLAITGCEVDANLVRSRFGLSEKEINYDVLFS